MGDVQTIAFERHLEQKKALQPSTVSAYLKGVHTFSRWLNQVGLSARSVEASDITRYLEVRKATPSYRNFVLGALRVWYDYLNEVGQISHNPARELKRSALVTKLENNNVLTTEEVRRLREVVVSHSRSFERARNTAIVSLLLDGGLSTQELCSLNDADIDDQGDHFVMLVRGIKGKQRSVVLKGEAQQALRGWLDERMNIVRYIDGLHQQPTFWEVTEVAELRVLVINRPSKDSLWPIPAHRKKGWPLTDQGVRFMLKHFAKLAGIEKNVTPQLLKRTFAQQNSS